MGIKYDDLVAYVDACENLAAGVAADIKKGPKYSVNTIGLLNKHRIAALKLKELFDKVELDKKKLN